MKILINWFNEVLTASIQLYFRQETQYHSIYDIQVPAEAGKTLDRLPLVPTFDETVVLMLAFMPHVAPQILDIFFVHNKNFDRPYTEFGGWKGISHGGFLPTGETAAFILAGENPDKRTEVMKFFSPSHWFHTENILRLEGQGEGEPFLSGQIRLSAEVFHRLCMDEDYKPDYSINFPAKRVTTSLDWDDMKLDYSSATQLEEINNWIIHNRLLMEDWGLKRIIKPGYRALFYGPPGTGKTLAATLLGKRNQMDVYRIDLSMIVSKYIGETEKNLARIFDLAENRRWILFFDEADALFGKRTSTQTSNDRHANQEVAYLLQRIEDFPGTIILATNLRTNIDEAFSRRFQSVIYFPMPTEDIRKELWENMIPPEWTPDMREQVIEQAATYELSGGAMTNVIRSCALWMIASSWKTIDLDILTSCIKKEALKNSY